MWAHGATVVLLGRTVRKLERVYDEIERAGHPQPAIYPLNLEGAVPKDYHDLAVVLDKESGRTSMACCTMPLFPRPDAARQLFDRGLASGVTGQPQRTVHADPGAARGARQCTCRLGVHRWRAGRGGRTGGLAGIAKAGLESLTKMLANELETNTRIRVNAIDPGKARTTLRLNAYPAGNQADWIEPDDLMEAYLYLMGDASVGITGRGSLMRAP
ncbi:MAG: SDR family oxidoreductase [Gammaproteobacteria bacterium]